MTTETSAIHAWLCAFADALELRSGLADVLVTTGYVEDTGKRDSIQIADQVDGEQTWGLLGNRRRDETFTASGIIWVKRAGKGEDVIRAVRERAFDLLAEIEDELRLRPRVSSTVKLAAITRYSVDQGANTDGRWCQLDFEVSSQQTLAS